MFSLIPCCEQVAKADWYPVVVRITSQTFQSEQRQALENVYGAHLKVVKFGEMLKFNPYIQVRKLIEEVEQETTHYVKAVEVEGDGLPVIQLTRYLDKLGVKLIRPCYETDDEGNLIVLGTAEYGREFHKFSHYEELKRVEIVTQRFERE